MAEVHLTLVLATAVLVIYSDKVGFSWVRGRVETLSKKKLEILHLAVGIGLAGILLTGGLMFLDRAEYLLGQPVFLAKMAFVASLVVNALFIGSLSKVASERSFASLTPKERIPLYISGGVSIVGWVSAIALGFILGN